MGRQKHIKIFLFVLVVTGLIALFFVPGISPPAILIAFLTLLPAWFLFERRDLPRSYYLLWLILAISFILGSIIEMVVAQRSTLETLPVQLIILQISRLFTLTNRRTLFESWLCALAMVVTATLVSSSFLLLILLTFFLIFSVRFLIQLTILDSPLPSQKFSLQLIVSMSFFACLLTGLLFLLLPRFRAISQQFPSSPTNFGRNPEFLSSNFTDNFYLGSLANLLKDPAEILQIKFARPYPNDTVYLRGDALDEFDGLQWRKSPATAKVAIIQPADFSAVIFLKTAAAKSADLEDYIKYQINYTQLLTDAVFGIPPLMAIENKGIRLRTSPNQGIRLMVNKISEELTLYSLPVKAQDSPIFPPLPEDMKAKYLELPEIPGLAEIEELAQRITRGCTTDFERSRAIADYLRSNYAYSLRSAGAHEKKAIRDFLFEHRRGHCAFFATAMVLLHRSLGIPARVAVGYMVELPEAKKQIVRVKNRDAHVWVEASCDQRGWFQFDPTPPQPLAVVSHNILFAQLFRWWENFSLQMRHYIRGYGVYVQQRLFATFSKMLTRLFPEPPSRYFWLRLINNIIQPRMMLLVLLVIIFDLAIIWTYFRLKGRYGGRREIYRHKQAPSGELTRLYWRICRWLGAGSRKRRANLTLKEIARGQQKINPQFYHRIQEVIDLYYAARFGFATDLKRVKKQIFALTRDSR